MSKVFQGVAGIPLEEHETPLWVRLQEASKQILQAAYDWADCYYPDQTAYMRPSERKLYEAVQHLRQLTKPPAVQPVSHAQLVREEWVDVSLDDWN